MARKPKDGEPSSPNPEDIDRFRAAVADVRPLTQSNRVRHALRRPKPIPLQSMRDERQALVDSLSDPIPWDEAMENGEELSYLRDGMARLTLRKLRGGHWVIQAELDLHGLSSVEARIQLAEFLNRCQKRGQRCVRVIHGKGLRSPNKEPVLKIKVKHWLMQRDEVLAFCQALPQDGGSGAAIVLLKSGP